jgi:hypothetical protein
MLFPRGEKYISPTKRLDSDHQLVIKNMPLNTDKTIGKLKDIALARCRERVEQAACKAKELMNKPFPEGQDMRARYYDPSSRITSSLKKKRGL